MGSFPRTNLGPIIHESGGRDGNAWKDRDARRHSDKTSGRTSSNCGLAVFRHCRKLLPGSRLGLGGQCRSNHLLLRHPHVACRPSVVSASRMVILDLRMVRLVFCEPHGLPTLVRSVAVSARGFPGTRDGGRLHERGQTLNTQSNLPPAGPWSPVGRGGADD